MTDSISRLEAALANIGDVDAPAGWEARVIAAIDAADDAARPAAPRPDPPRPDHGDAEPGPRRLLPRPRRLSLALGVLGAMAAAAMIAVGIGGRLWPRESRLEIEVSWQPIGPPVRGSAVRTGDVARVAATGGGRYRALWVYRNERELVAVCPGGMQCLPSPDATVAQLTLELRGQYTFVAVASASPVPAPRGPLDADLAAGNLTTQVVRLDVE